MRLVSRLSILALSTLASLGLVACGGGGGGGDDDDDADAAVGPDSADNGPRGDHYKSIANSIQLPDEAGEDEEFGINIDGEGDYDNRLGAILSTLRQAAGDALDLNSSLQKAIDDGSIILLGDVQAESLTTATNVGFTVYLGDNPNPAACTDPEDEATCGQHLTGTGTFDIKEGSPRNPPLVGNLVSGTFNAGPGVMTLQIALVTGGDPVTLNLVAAHTKITEFNGDGTIKTGVVAGAIKDQDLKADVIPAIAQTASNVIAEQVPACTPADGKTTTKCTCPDGTTAKTIAGLLDGDGDCAVTAAEILENDLVATLLEPDVDVLGADGNPGSDGVDDSLSIGVGITTVGALFTP